MRFFHVEGAWHGVPSHYSKEMWDRTAAQVLELRQRYKLTTPCIYVSGIDDLEKQLELHPEVNWMVSVCHTIDSSDVEGFREAAGGDLRHHCCAVQDYDERVDPAGHRHPKEKDLLPLLDFLKEWVSDGAGSIIIHCAAGQYRSCATAITAAVLAGADPVRAGLDLAMSGRFDWSNIDSNWVIGDVMDDNLKLGGRLSNVCRRMEVAVKERERLWFRGASEAEMRSHVESILASTDPTYYAANTNDGGRRMGPWRSFPTLEKAERRQNGGPRRDRLMIARVSRDGWAYDFGGGWASSEREAIRLVTGELPEDDLMCD